MELSDDSLLDLLNVAAAEEFRDFSLTSAQQAVGVSRALCFMAALVLQDAQAPPFTKEQVLDKPAVCRSVRMIGCLHRCRSRDLRGYRYDIISREICRRQRACSSCRQSFAHTSHAMRFVSW
jgi:hypothetical protein